MKTKVYANFILIKSLGTLGRVRFNITESNVSWQINRKVGVRKFQFFVSIFYRFLVWLFIKNRSRHLTDFLWQIAFAEKSLREGEFLPKIKE